MKKLAGLAAMAIFVTGAGWAVGSGAAQADTKHPQPHPIVAKHDPDGFVDRFFPNSPVDRFIDRLFHDQ